MGLSIHFSGRFRNAELLPAMIEEVIDVSKVYGWKYNVYNTHFPKNSFESCRSFDNIYGISFTPTDCETVSLTFLSDGTMVSPDLIAFFAHSEDETQRSYIYFISVKTQFAGVFVHLLLVKLLKYLNDKYFDCFKLDDESFYWETGNENLMRERFKLYDKMLDNVILSTQTFPIEPNEDIVAYFERLMKHIDNLKK